MANRNVTHILKNSDIVNRPLPSSLNAGEPIVNTADGILYFSGVTTSTSEWTPAGTGSTANFFEVGSNLYDLRLRNKITKYQNVSGSGLIGKFLSGTTNGFVLADISDIASTVDSYTTGATWSPNTLTLNLNNGRPSVPVTINSFNGIILYGNNTINGGLTITGTTNLNGLSYYNNNATVSNEIVNYGTLTSYTQSTEIYVTGGTNTASTDDTNLASIGLKYNRTISDGTYSLPYEDTYSTGATLVGTTLYFKRNDGSTYNVDLNSLSPTGVTDTYVTGFTYNNSNIITLSQNNGQPNLTVDISTLGSINVNGNVNSTGITITSLSPGKVVYVGSSNELKTEVGFEYDESTNRLNVGALTVNNSSGTTSYIGQGGLVIGSGGSHSTAGIGDLTVHGNFIVFGSATTVSTNELYVEDPQITLNYNPTGSTSSTSIGSGIRIQDGNGLTTGNTDVYLTIAQMNTFTGGDVTEYTGSNGYSNRAFITQLNDIVIRNTNLNNGAPDGVRVLGEFDILDGGTF